MQQGASNLLQGRAVLSAGLLEATRLKDANIQEPSKAAVQSVEFHPSGQLLFTAGLDKALRFFSVRTFKIALPSCLYSNLMLSKRLSGRQGH